MNSTDHQTLGGHHSRLNPSAPPFPAPSGGVWSSLGLFPPPEVVPLQEKLNGIVVELEGASKQEQRYFIERVFSVLSSDVISFARYHLDTIIRKDFIGALPPEIARKIIVYLDVGSLGRMARVCRDWFQAVGQIWQIACSRIGIQVDSDDSHHWICRYRRVIWRQKLWASDPGACFLPSPSHLQTDQNTVTYIGDPYGRSGHLAAAVSPGVVVFYPERQGGVTNFLRTGLAVRPTSLCASESAAVLGFGDGSVQLWHWRTNQLLLEFANVSLSTVMTVDQAPSFDLLVVGSDDGSISLWRLSSAQFIQSVLDVSTSVRGGVKKLKFLERFVEEEGQSVRRLFLVVISQVQTISFMFGTRTRSLCNLAVWEVDSWGLLEPQVLSRCTQWGHEVVKDSLKVNSADGTLLFLTETPTNPGSETDGHSCFLHEFDPISGLETVCALELEPTELEAGQQIREWQLLGVGRRFAAVCVWDLGRKDASDVILAVFERTSTVGSSVEGWRRVLRQSLAGPPMLSCIKLGCRDWLDGFDGANDCGLVLVGCFWDYIEGLWKMKPYFWSEATP